LKNTRQRGIQITFWSCKCFQILKNF
jgi:hypothetical protein